MLGARMHYAVPKMLHQAGLLGRFYTDVYAGNKPLLQKVISIIPEKRRPRSVKKLIGRCDAEIPSDKVFSFDIFGFATAFQVKRHKTVGQSYDHLARSAKRFNELIISRGLEHCNMVFGFDGASRELFNYARGRGILCVLEQTIAPIRVQNQLLSEELRRWPDWEYQHFLPEDEHPFIDREEREWEIADVIIGGSDFVIEGLSSLRVEPGKCRVVPYGVDLERFSRTNQKKSSRGKLRVLFMGQVGLRKGVPYLLEALNLLGTYQIEVKMAGKVSISRNQIAPYTHIVSLLGEVPRVEIGNLYSWADILVLPSLCEGSATVTYEAMASGVPVIATPNTGSLVRDGVDGRLVPIRDGEAIASALDAYLSDRSLLETHTQGAWEGRWRCGLDAYRERLVREIKSAWEGSS